MWHNISNFALNNPSVAIFLTLGLGYFVGRFHIKSFKLGTTVGVLLVGLVIGQLGKFQIAPVVKNLFFDLFIFTIGYEVGPAFINSFKKKGLKFIIQSVVFTVIAFAVAMGLFKVFHVQFGEAGGIIAGALTQSSCIGTANSAIEALHISQAAKTAAMSQVAIAYALTYVFGTVGVLIFLKNIAPAILRVNLREATKKYIEENHISNGDQGLIIEEVVRDGKMSELDANNFHLNLKKATVLLTKAFSYGALEQILSNGVLIDTAEHDGQKITDYTRLTVGDHVTIIGPANYLTNAIKTIGYEKVTGTKTDVSFMSIDIFLGILLGAIVITIHKIPLTLGGGGGALFAGLYFGWLQ